jgi:hypothetical protein
MSRPRYSRATLRANLAGDLSLADMKPETKKKRSYEESENQIALFSWWEMACKSYGIARCLMFAIPNGSALGTGKEDWQVRQRAIRGKRLKAEGLTPGVPDVFLAVPRRPRPWSHGETTKHYSGLFVEMKTSKGVVSPAQQQIIGYLLARDYKCAVARSFDEARKVIEEYLNK